MNILAAHNPPFELFFVSFTTLIELKWTFWLIFDVSVTNNSWLIDFKQNKKSLAAHKKEIEAHRLQNTGLEQWFSTFGS